MFLEAKYPHNHLNYRENCCIQKVDALATNQQRLKAGQNARLYKLKTPLTSFLAFAKGW